jgi:hypothetical protein
LMISPEEQVGMHAYKIGAICCVAVISLTLSHRPWTRCCRVLSLSFALIHPLALYYYIFYSCDTERGASTPSILCQVV